MGKHIDSIRPFVVTEDGFVFKYKKDQDWFDAMQPQKSKEGESEAVIVIEFSKTGRKTKNPLGN